MENGFSEYKKIRGINAASPTKTVLVTFLLIILAGALLLSLPISVSRGRADFFTALFTSTSATCVTGLSLVDMLSHWSRFGHVVILLLIQVGGLGFMAFATALAPRQPSSSCDVKTKYKSFFASVRFSKTRIST